MAGMFSCPCGRCDRMYRRPIAKHSEQYRSLHHRCWLCLTDYEWASYISPESGLCVSCLAKNPAPCPSSEHLDSYFYCESCGHDYPLSEMKPMPYLDTTFIVCRSCAVLPATPATPEGREPTSVG